MILRWKRTRNDTQDVTRNERNSYRIFYAVPCLITFLTLVMALLFWKQYEMFRASYLAEIREELTFQCNVAATVLTPFIAHGETEKVQQFFRIYSNNPRRLTLIAPSGQVLAESDRPGNLGNHLTRKEIQEAFAIGKATHAVHFSETMEKWMFYYALPMEIGTETYVLRISLPIDSISEMMMRVVWFIALSIIGGVGLATLITCYIIYRIRLPLAKLQESTVRIADGDLSGVVFVPKKGVTRQLALAVAEMTKQLRQRIGELTVLESFQSEFVANVSHEIKTPLTGILSAVEMLEDGAKDQPEMRDRCLAILSLQSHRLHSLVLDILSLAKLEQKCKNHLSKTDFTPISPQAILQSAVAVCAESAKKNGTEVVILCVDNPTIQGNSQLLEQAVTNLIINALRYSGSPRVEISSRLHENQLILAVRDFGIGIPEEHHGRIFERFYRVHKERSRELGGTGLGLAIVKHIVQLHNGHVEIHSKPGKGAEFLLILPIIPEAL